MKNAESVTKYMATKLITFTPDIDIRTAIQTIVKNKISGAPVVNKKGELVGIISEKDCIKTIVEGPYNRLPGGKGTVGDFMSTAVTTISSDKTVLDAAYEFALTQYRRFPVTEDGRLVGQISRRDILRAILKLKPEITHTPSSWKGREPQIHPSKTSQYNQNS